MSLISITTQFLALATIAMQVTVVILLLSLLSYSKIRYAKVLVDIVGKNAIGLTALIALAATTGSLFYSEIAQFEPCNLCWYQRIFLYPQVLLLGIALFKKYKGIADYIIGLSVIGGMIASYHYIIQITQTTGTICSVLEGFASCVTIHIMEYGYITMPLMSLTVFVLIILLMVAQKRSRML